MNTNPIKHFVIHVASLYLKDHFQRTSKNSVTNYLQGILVSANDFDKSIDKRLYLSIKTSTTTFLMRILYY